MEKDAIKDYHFQLILLAFVYELQTNPFYKVVLTIMLNSAIKSSELYASIYHVHHLQ